MNIWLLTGEYPPDYGGGIAAYSHQTVEMLRQRGHHLTVIAAVEGPPGSIQMEEPAEHLRVVRFGANQSPQSGSLGAEARLSYDAALVLEKFSRQEGQPDVLEAQDYLGMPYFTMQRRFLMGGALNNLPMLVTSHTPLYVCWRYDQTPAYRFPGYWLGEMERYSLLAADGVVFPSRHLRDEIEGDLPQICAHSQIIANPYRLLDSHTTQAAYSERRGFLYTAKIQRLKGIEPLLAAFSRLWDAGMDEPLFLLGGDWFDGLHQRWMSDEIRQRYSKYIDAALLHWEGKQPPTAVAQRLGQVRAMVLPSLFENFPYAVLEAMAAGVPVIASSSGGHAEIVEDGKSGFVFSNEKRGELEEKIQALFALTSTEYIQMSAAAQERVKQISDYDVVAPQKEEALQWARDQAKKRKVFPFLHPLASPEQPPAEQVEAGERGLLSVVIPFYNLGNFLEDTLKPLANMAEVPHEIILVDDGTTDPRSRDILKNLQERYPFRLERTPNRGLASARNTGASLARGEFLAFIDADDWMDPRFYPQALKALQQHTDISFVGCWVEYFDGAEGYWPTWNPEPPYALVHNPLNTSALVYRKADFLRYGLNDPEFKIAMEDYDSLLGMLENGCRGVVLPEPYHKYRVRADSMYHVITDSIKISIYQQLAAKHAGLFAAYAGEVFNLVNTNGPGYLYDNPTQWYPKVGYLRESDPALNPGSNASYLSTASAKTLFYYLSRSILAKPYDKLLGIFPGLKKTRDRLKLRLTRN